MGVKKERRWRRQKVEIGAKERNGENEVDWKEVDARRGNSR